MLLEAAHISKRFGSRPQVLTDVSFGVEPGEFVSVIGPSGAGKTTLFRILNGTLPCDGGEVTPCCWKLRTSASASALGRRC